LLSSLQRRHFDATHHCSAWRLRDGVWRANDAGEPSGSAGAPLLAAIDAAGLTDAAVVVVRYFGGTRLGVGGLVRAYGEVAMLALEAAPRRSGVPARRVVVRYPYSQTAVVIRAIEVAGGAEIEHGFAVEIAGGETTAAIPAPALDGLVRQLRELTAGEVQPDLLDLCTLYRSASTPTRGPA
jgi:putative IMPACT (imprinted ancient) family translation regulator